jgi:hypothetical protein
MPIDHDPSIGSRVPSESRGVTAQCEWALVADPARTEQQAAPRGVERPFPHGPHR